MKISTVIKNLLVVALTVPFWWGCEEKTDIVVNDLESNYVIEGWVTTDPGPYQIKISQTIPYFSSGGEEFVDDAVVIIVDETEGVTDTLTLVGEGVYETSSIVGEKFHTYHLYVTVEDNNYEGVATIQRINPITALIPTYLDEPLFPGQDTGWYVTFLAEELAGVGDFYRFFFYQNDSLYSSPDDIFVTDDKTIDGTSTPFPFFTYVLEAGDTIEIEVLSIEEFGYDYYVQLQNEIFSAGSPFGSPPANLVGNITGGALGIFGAGAIERKEVIIPL